MQEKKKYLKPLLILLSIALFVLLWHIAASIIDFSYLLPQPMKVFGAFFGLLTEGVFWRALATSVLYIYAGAVIGMLIGLVIGVLTVLLPPLDTMLSPVFSIIRATPVACFIVLAWILIEATIGAKYLPLVISAMMVAPVMMTGTQGGIRSTPRPLLEAASIYRLSWWQTVRTCYLPATLPHIFTAVLNCIGLAWKAGIAAEIIILIKGTIGYEIYQERNHTLNSARLYAWTLAVILISLAFEYLFSHLAKVVKRRIHV